MCFKLETIQMTSRSQVNMPVLMKKQPMFSPETLARIIEEGEYCVQQVFNAAKTGLFGGVGGGSSSRTYIA